MAAGIVETEVFHIIAFLSKQKCFFSHDGIDLPCCMSHVSSTSNITKFAFFGIALGYSILYFAKIEKVWGGRLG